MPTPSGGHICRGCERTPHRHHYRYFGARLLGGDQGCTPQDLNARCWPSDLPLPANGQKHPHRYILYCWTYVWQVMEVGQRSEDEKQDNNTASHLLGHPKFSGHSHDGADISRDLTSHSSFPKPGNRGAAVSPRADVFSRLRGCARNGPRKHPETGPHGTGLRALLPPVGSMTAGWRVEVT